MVLRIEYLLLLVLLILAATLLWINPKSQLATSVKGDKEIAFQNFSFYDIKEAEPLDSISASKMVKYENYIALENIDLQDESGYQILSNKAIYENEFVQMDKGVTILRNDGLKFLTKSLSYNTKTKDIKTAKPFILEFNASIIQGENLALNMDSKIITADNIEAKIVFENVSSK
jgi:LPS export ABC transporter protein LptC